ncbi:hypothetical protein L873DRAFT_1847811 [Choiromyces venosus 120613-1]|uniref:CCHC-type domain-containing protein n=1 Tax=Choiromyces venosus 120613-1 TaxID=1336337 RepID=A0A3N4JEL7_9PEZI|nr:hypothetical protein L873DRAFT_1847811 [Choiromyces venosus 120613-1]
MEGVNDFFLIFILVIFCTKENSSHSSCDSEQSRSNPGTQPNFTSLQSPVPGTILPIDPELQLEPVPTQLDAALLPQLKMAELKLMDFGGTMGENVEHFLYDFEIIFVREGKKTETAGSLYPTDVRAHRVIQHLKPGSQAFKFVHRLPLSVTKDYDALCRELRARFENSAEIEEEKRRAEESFLCLRQKSGQSIEAYVKLTRKVAHGMSSEFQHLVATQFVKGLDSRELRMQAMSGLANRPSVEDAIMKVQRLWSIMEEDHSSGDEDIDLTDSEDDSDEEFSGRRRRKQRAKKIRLREEKRRKKEEKKTMKETERIREELEELKQWVGKRSKTDQEISGTVGVPRMLSMGESNSLPTIEVYAVGNRLAPSPTYSQAQPMRNPYSYNNQERPNSPWGRQVIPSHENGAPWSRTGQQQRAWQNSRYGRGGTNMTNDSQQYEPGYHGNSNYPRYQRRDRSQSVCYQCGVVGHLRYECHLSNQRQPDLYLRPTNSQQQPPGATGNQTRDRQEDIARREQYRSAREDIRERHGWGTQERTCGEPDKVQQSSAVNGMVVEVIREYLDGRTKQINIRGNDRFAEIESSWESRNEELEEVRLDEKEFVKELTNRDKSQDAQIDQRLAESDVMAGEKARLRSKLTESSASAEGQPPRQRLRTTLAEQDKNNKQPRQKKLPTRQSGHRPIRLMAGRQGFDFISGFRDTEVTGLTWGQFFDLSPEGKHQFVKLMVQERPRGKNTTSKGKRKVEAKVMESILSEAALVGKREPNFEVANFYTKARIRLNNHNYEINHILIDAGSVVNLAPITVLQAIRAIILPTKELVIRTAASNLVPLEFYADLEVEVASRVTPLRIFAMPESCEPTYGLPLSRRWLRVCQAVGDYRHDVYVIKDAEGRDHNVPREVVTIEKGRNPRVLINPAVVTSEMDDELVEELELENGKSFEEVVRQIVSEARSELAIFQALEDYGSSHDYRDSGGITSSDEMKERGTESGSQDEFEERWEAKPTPWRDQEPPPSRFEKLMKPAEVGLSTGVRRIKDLHNDYGRRQKKVLHWVDDSSVDDEERKLTEEKEEGRAFIEADVHFYSETGKWVTKKLGK